jgi:hypothetical protein
MRAAARIQNPVDVKLIQDLLTPGCYILTPCISRAPCELCLVFILSSINDLLVCKEINYYYCVWGARAR